MGLLGRLRSHFRDNLMHRLCGGFGSRNTPLIRPGRFLHRIINNLCHYLLLEAILAGSNHELEGKIVNIDKRRTGRCSGKGDFVYIRVLLILNFR